MEILDSQIITLSSSEGKVVVKYATYQKFGSVTEHHVELPFTTCNNDLVHFTMTKETLQDLLTLLKKH